MRKLKTALLATSLLVSLFSYDTSSATSAQDLVHSQSLKSQYCLTSIWKMLLPLMAKNNSYISIEDMEQVTGVKIQHVVKVGPIDTIGIYEQLATPLASGSYSTFLSLRVEIHEDNLPPIETFSTWRALQWQPGSTSTVDLSCNSTLSVKQAEGDLRALGLRSAGVLSKGIERAEVFVNDWNEQVYLYYTIPTIVNPLVSSIRIIGQKAPKKPPIKWPQ